MKVTEQLSKTPEKIADFIKKNERVLFTLAEAFGRMIGALAAYAIVATLLSLILTGVFGLGLGWWQVFSGVILIRVVRSLLLN